MKLRKPGIANSVYYMVTVEKVTSLYFCHFKKFVLIRCTENQIQGSSYLFFAMHRVEILLQRRQICWQFDMGLMLHLWTVKYMRWQRE